MNLYLYCRAGPVNFIDPNGHEPLFLGGVQPGGPMRAWKANADAFARWAQEGSKERAEHLAENRETIRQLVEYTDGSTAVGIGGGVLQFAGAIGASVLHPAGTFFDVVAKTRSVVKAPTAEEAAKNLGPIQSLDAAKAAAEAGDTPGVVESILSFGLQTFGLANTVASAPSIKFDAGSGPLAPAGALAGGGTAAVPAVGTAVAVGGGGPGFLGGLIALATDIGNDGGDAPASSTTTGPSTKTLAEWLKDQPELLAEARKAFKESPQWFGIDPDKTPVFYRLPADVRAIRLGSASERGGHHPHGLSLGGPKGQKLTPTGEGPGRPSNPAHDAVGVLEDKIRAAIKSQQAR